MDLTLQGGQAQTEPAPSLQAFQREHLEALVQGLQPLDALIGHAVEKTVMPRGGIVALEIERAKLVETCWFLRDALGFTMLTSVSGVDMRDHLEVVYHLRALNNNWLLQVKVKLEPGKPEVESLVSVWLSANWLERETYDLFGIVFLGHPDLRRILLDDEFEGFPLLKSFRPTPMTVHDRATTQVPPEEALSSEAQQRGVERVVAKRLGQGQQERLHPGTPTFGHTQYHTEPKTEGGH
ncbi:MAG TPA: NADH-quinone oxidoreductase subunit C [Ktedonobacterales bacterium]|jgi:NADH/F420H2 dehydrogenase subunit C